MPSPYSVDLRKRAIDAYLNSQKTTLEKIAKQFQIGEKTLRNWLRLHEKTGSLEAKRGYQKGHSHVISDDEEFKKFILENDFSTREEIVQKLGRGSVSSIGRALKKIKFVKKKDKILY
jgi:transposase